MKRKTRRFAVGSVVDRTIIFIDDETGAVTMKVRRISFKGELFLEQSLWTDRKLLKKRFETWTEGRRGLERARTRGKRTFGDMVLFLRRGVMECKVPD